ncbi:MAG: hypothetical protein AAGA96_03325 [Verrucomicrobiota bacterium]
MSRRLLRPPSPERQLLSSKSNGATLVELLASMGILSVLLLVLGVSLEASLGRFRSGVDRSESRSDVQSAVDWIRRDLFSSIAERPARVQDLPETTPQIQRDFFSDKILLPFEVDRFNSDGGSLPHPVSLPNASPEFGSLAFVSLLPVPDFLRSPATSGSETAPSIVAYYVAFTRKSSLASEEAPSMKLFRHYRPGGTNLLSAHARGILSHVSHVMNDTNEEAGNAFDLTQGNPALIRQGVFENQLLPSLLGFRIRDLINFDPVAVTPPWPIHPIPERLQVPPPSLNPDRGSITSWSDPGHSVHDTVFPDEPICENVVRFQLRPLRRFENPDGSIEWLDAEALNLKLGLSGGPEWPCLVQPDVIELTLGTIDSTIAQRLSSYEDWIVDWSQTQPNANSTLQDTIRRNIREKQIRLVVRNSS